MTSAASSIDYKSMPDNNKLAHIPGNYGKLPYIGNSLDMIDDLYGFVERNYKQYGEIFKIKLGGQVGVMVIGPDNMQRIYLDKDKNFSTQMGYQRSLGYFYQGGLLLRDSDDHKFQRRMFQTAFKNEVMRGYVDIMNPLFEEHVQSWGNIGDFHFFPEIKRALLDVGASVFIGVKEHGPEMQDLNNAFLNVSEKGLMGLFKYDIPGLKFHAGMNGKRFLEKYFADLIPQRRAGDGKDMMSIVCREKMDNGEYYPDSDLIPQLSFLLFAAHDTTTSVLTHMMLYSGQYPEWQEKMREEARALNKSEIAYEDLDNLVIMDRVFKESLRLNPSVSMMTRRTINECELGGQRIPANTILFIPAGYNHRLEKYWPDPLKFDPDRFSPEREEFKNHSFCYIPFGGGAHKCIGLHFANMMSKAVMQKILLNYEWSVPAGYDPKIEAFPLPKPADNLPLSLKRIA